MHRDAAPGGIVDGVGERDRAAQAIDAGDVAVDIDIGAVDAGHRPRTGERYVGAIRVAQDLNAGAAGIAACERAHRPIERAIEIVQAEAAHAGRAAVIVIAGERGGVA